MGKSDYVVITCPLTEETKDIIGSNELSSMKSDSILVNVARGAIVNEDALVTALQKGHIGGAALDVQTVEPLPPESPLWNLSNVIITPHMGGATPHYWNRCAEIFSNNYEEFDENKLDKMENRII